MTLKNHHQKSKNYALRAFLYGLLVALAVVLPVIIKGQGYFLYYGDFNVQQIPFYTLAHDSILSGNTSWSHITDLGANFVGSYTFYVLTSPFFLITLLFDTAVVPYLMGPLLILKLAFCTLSGYVYLRRYVSDKRYAVLGGLMYAFSGFSLYNVFFFHFHEAMIIFPLLLSAVDEFIYTKRKGVLALAVFGACVLNYYFFFGQVVFVAIYFFVRLFSSKSFKISFNHFLLMAFECIVGVCMACCVLIPSLGGIISNSRLNDFLVGYDALLYDTPQRYLHIIESMFFPPDIPARANFTPDSNSNWASIALWVPMFSVTFVIGYLISHSKSWLKRLTVILLVMAFVPILNSMYQAFNDCYYARWFYMLELIFILCTVISLDNITQTDYVRAYKWCAFFTIILTVSVGLMPRKTYDIGDTTVYRVGLEQFPDRFWIYVGISLVSLVLGFLIIKYAKNKKELFVRLTAISLCVVIIGYSEYILFTGKSEADESDEFTIKHALNFGEDITISDIDDVRSDFYNSMDNIGMFWQIPNIQAFHSIVPASTMDFYNSIGSVRDVASRPECEYYGVRGLLSVKYLFDCASDGDDFSQELDFKNTKMPGYKYIDTQNGFDIYENEYYVPMGFMYDDFICKEEYNNLSDEVKHLVLMKAMVLSQDQMKKYCDITGYTNGMYIGLNADYTEDNLQNLVYPIYKNFESKTSTYSYKYNDYYSDCENRASTSCSSFEYTKNGFRATCENKGDDNLLFFSVPYDEGFEAFVNGQKVEIEKVNIGFMAVKVDAHSTSEIEFVYTTPGLKTGIIISCIGFLAFAIYLVISKGFMAEKKYRKIYRIKK